LTASPGTNKSTNEESAIVHLKTLMANLSVSNLSVVRKYEEEIKQYSATPYKGNTIMIYYYNFTGICME
jgi:hypothetical protein